MRSDPITEKDMLDQAIGHFAKLSVRTAVHLHLEVDPEFREFLKEKAGEYHCSMNELCVRILREAF